MRNFILLANNPSLGVMSLILCGHLISTMSLSPTNPSGEPAKKLYSASTNRPVVELLNYISFQTRLLPLAHIEYHN